MEAINNVSRQLTEGVQTRFKRFLLATIDWSQRLIEIRGSRGVGKTTVLRCICNAAAKQFSSLNKIKNFAVLQEALHR